MTPAQMHDEIQAIRSTLPASATVGASVASWVDRARCAHVFASLNEAHQGETIHVYAETWDDAFTQLRFKIRALAETREARMIRRLGPAVIECAGGSNSCTSDDLLSAGFTVAEVEGLGTAACEHATRLAHGTPFSIAPAATAPAARHHTIAAE